MTEVYSSQSLLEGNSELIDQFLRSVKSQPESFAVPSKALSSQALKVAKTLFDHAKIEEVDTIGRVGDLTELLVDGFDTEQIWQELELQNEPLYQHLSEITEELLDNEDSVDLAIGSDDEVSGEESLNSDEEEEAEESDVSASSERGSDSDESIDDDDEEAAIQAKLMRESLRGDDEKRAKKLKAHPLDDEFFDFAEMERFADEGETGGGLLTNTGDSDEDEIYELMYGGADDEEEEDGETRAKSATSQKKRAREAELDPEEAALEQALNRKRRMLQVDDDEDDEDDEDLLDGEDDDVDAEDAYFEDFFSEPDPARSQKGKGKSKDDRESAGGMDLDEDDEYYRDDDDDLPEEFEEGQDEEVEELDYDDDDDDDDDESLTTHQREQRAREREMRRMEKAMMAEDERDASTLLSTGGLGVSSFEAHQRHLEKKKSKLEDELISKKRWTLAGEIKANQRGVNTLLEEDLDFELATKQAPIVSADVTRSLEETIKRRIIDRVFDDPVRKLAKPDRGDYRSRVAELDQEKSSKSLAQIYEDDYMRQTQGVKDEDQLSEAHKACIVLFKSICQRMDALANAQYTPLKVKEEVDVVPLKDAAAIRMEEVTPVTASAASLLVPSEVYTPATKGAARGDSEWTREERRAQRRERKKRHAKERSEQEEEKKRLDAGSGSDKATKKTPSVAEALKTIAKGPNTTISKNSDRTHYTSTAAFQKIAEAAAATPSTASKRA